MGLPIGISRGFLLAIQGLAVQGREVKAVQKVLSNPPGRHTRACGVNEWVRVRVNEWVRDSD